MPSFSKKSKEKLATCHEDIQLVFNIVIEIIDITILCGHRTLDQQFEEYKKGREEIDGKFQIVDKSKVVTYIDGNYKISDHNREPSLAVDVVPYPIDWNDIERFKKLAGIVNRVSNLLYEMGVTHNKISWGGDWSKFKDYPHFYISKT